MARIGFVHLAVICGTMLVLNLEAQVPSEPPLPPGSEMDGMDKPPRPLKKNPDGSEKERKDGMGRGGMFGPNMGGPQFEKMVDLALAPEKDLQEALQKWPHIQEKEPEAQERFLKQLENFRRFLKNQALKEAGELGLQIKPEQEDAFVRDFWKKKLAVDQTLRKEMEPRKRELTNKMNEELKKDFDSLPAAPAP